MAEQGRVTHRVMHASLLLALGVVGAYAKETSWRDEARDWKAVPAKTRYKWELDKPWNKPPRDFGKALNSKNWAATGAAEDQDEEMPHHDPTYHRRSGDPTKPCGRRCRQSRRWLARQPREPTAAKAAVGNRHRS